MNLPATTLGTLGGETLNRARSNRASGFEEVVVICPDAMEQLRSLDPDDGNLVQDLITIFIEESPDLIDRASRGLDQGNAVEVERAAHSLKGGSRNFGAERLAALAYRLEQAGKRIDLTEATVLLPVIREAFEEVRSELLTYAGT